VDSDTQVTATVPTGATTGKVSVTGPGGTGTSTGDFTVTVPPIVLSIAPNSAVAGDTVNVSINGENFAAGAQVTITGGQGPAPSTSNVQIQTASTITATLSLKQGGPAGTSAWDVAVTNSDGNSGTLAGGFSITK
jgi:hypothetical protein